MMGERVGGPGDGIREGRIQEVIIKGNKSSWWKRNIWGPIGNIFSNSSSKNATAGVVPTFSQAPDYRKPTTTGGWLQSYRDYEPSPTDLGGQVVKPILNGLLDLGNLVRNGAADKSDYSGLGPRMTKWDGNTMSATESQDAKFNAFLTADGLVTAGVGFSIRTTTDVYRVQRTGQFLELDDAGNVIYNSMNGKPKTIYMFVGDEASALNYARNKPGSTITKFEIDSKYASKILELKHPQNARLKSISASDKDVFNGYNRIGVHSNKIKGFLKWQKPGSGKIIKPK